MPSGQVGMIPSGGSFGYPATTDPLSDQTTHLLANLVTKAILATFTQTYATAATTVPAATAVAAVTTAATQTTPFGYATQAQADALVTGVNALILDVLALRQTMNGIIDLLQAAGLAG